MYTASNSELLFRNMDWKLCLICQKATKEVIKWPLNVFGSASLLTPYETFLERSAMFRELNRLPVALGHLRENITAEALVENKASWHKTCHKKFDQDKLIRTKGRGLEMRNKVSIWKEAAHSASYLRSLLAFYVERRLVLFMNS